MEALIAAKELKKGFGARTLFDSLHFSVHSGERIGLIGPNGAGKSTLLRLLAGELDADGGEVVPRRGLRVAYLEQTPRLAPSKSILETILEGAADAPEPVALALELFSKVGLDTLGRPPETSLGTLSGGWQKRAALARELAKRPDLLLLDEPTNHLDIEGILWLEEWLRRAPFAAVTVTHDRVFLQNVSNRILELDRRNPGGLLSVAGDYAKYLERKEQLLDAQASREESLRNRLRRETEWLRRGAKARTTKQQARISRAGELGEEVADLAERNQTSFVRLDFAGTERQTKRLIEAKQIAKGYDGHRLFAKLDVFLGPGTRLGLLGPNGCGKSTLIRLLLGHEPPDAGTIVRADQLRVSYFEQNRQSLDPCETVKTAVCPTGDHVKFQGRFLHVRSYLDRFLFAREQTDLPIAKLSGGEQARLLLARLMLEEADVLVLDEPTNDLDISTLDVLQGCLEEFPGAVILVSHDRYFLDQVSTELLAFTKDTVRKFADLAQWEAWRTSFPSAPKPAAAPSPPEPTRKKRKLSYHESRDLETIESRIHAAEARVADLSRQAESAAADAGRLAEIYRNLGEAQAEVDRLFERWQELEALKASLD